MQEFMRWPSTEDGLLIKLFILDIEIVWINDWVNNLEAGDLRCYRAYYDVILMKILMIYIRLRVCIVSALANDSKFCYDDNKAAECNIDAESESTVI